MRMKNKSIAFLAMALCCAVSCSTTSHLAENEVLYTGVDRITTHVSDTVDAAVDEAMRVSLEVTPTNSFFGSAYHQSPLPIGLWVYNSLYPEHETGFKHWLWSVFKSDPKYVSAVNPRLRAQAAEAILKDEGYFDAVVTFDTIYNKEDSLQARLAYDVTYNHQSKLGKIELQHTPSYTVDRILKNTQADSYLHTGDRFSASVLESEKNRISEVMRDSGFFFFTPDKVKYLGDSTLATNTVSLRVVPEVSTDVKAMRPCVIDSVLYHLDYGYGMKLQHYDSLGFMSVGYNGKQMVKTKFLRRALNFREGAIYKPDMDEKIKKNLSRLNAFQYTTTEFTVLNPEREMESMSLDPANDTLRMRLKIHAVNAVPWSGGTEVGVVYKDNEQIGPGATFTAQRRNLFGGGEMLSGEFSGSYEWYTGKGGTDLLPNSFEFGTKLSYSIPRLPFPCIWHANPDNPFTSRYSLSVDWQRRGGYFEMVKTSAAMEYTFTRGENHSFIFTPLRLTYLHTLNTTASFDSIVSKNLSLQNSLQDQFIPQMSFTWIYDNSSTRSEKASQQYLRLSAAEAGGVSDILMGLFGEHKKQGERQIWGQRFSQFFKFTSEFRNNYHITPRQSIVTRLLAGFGYAYGNSTDMPYSESFYIGGANSLRGFAARSVGPGSFNLEALESVGIYQNIRLFCVGDYKLEANLEYRFPLSGNLYGAMFVDAGNIWVFSSDNDEEYKTIYEILGYPKMIKNPINQIALDCGFGFRYDLGMLVLRFDVGVPLHDPNADFSDSYFNCRNGFFKNLGYNLAVGYPF